MRVEQRNVPVLIDKRLLHCPNCNAIVFYKFSPKRMADVCPGCGDWVEVVFIPKLHLTETEEVTNG